MNVIDFNEYRERKNFDRNEDPCRKCPTQKGCCTTCENAKIWYNLLAELLIGKDIEETIA
jgi:hypothetical protein